MKVNKNYFAALFLLACCAVAIVDVVYVCIATMQSTPKKVSPSNHGVSLIAVGDIMLSRTVASKIKVHGDNNYPFLKVADFLRAADITFGNLENPITAGPAVPPREMVLRADPGVENALKDAGFGILSLANNHTPNFGTLGLTNTFNYLDKVGIAHVGAGKNSTDANQPAYITRQGITFAFLAYNDTDVVPESYEATEQRAGTAFMRTEKMITAVHQAKRTADVVIVSMHAGNEYSHKPDESQVHFAHAAIDAGAEIVIGHHPHVIQPIEQYRGKYILYSLGNFVFDQMQSADTREGLVAKMLFTQRGLSSISFSPVLIQDFSQPEFLTGAAAGDTLKKLDFPLTRMSVFEWNTETKQFNEVVEHRPTTQELTATSTMADLDSDGKMEKIILENGRLKVFQENTLKWISPDAWRVDNFVLADSDNDGTLNINMSVWKSGNFGSSQPFWIKKNDPSIKNHFFVFNFVGGKMKPVWQSSNLSAPNCEFKIADVDSDGNNDLIVLEGDYTQKAVCDAHYVAVWKWNGWGFSNEWRSERGDFQDLTLEVGARGRRVVVNAP